MVDVKSREEHLHRALARLCKELGASCALIHTSSFETKNFFFDGSAAKGEHHRRSLVELGKQALSTGDGEILELGDSTAYCVPMETLHGEIEGVLCLLDPTVDPSTHADKIIRLIPWLRVLNPSESDFAMVRLLAAWAHAPEAFLLACVEPTQFDAAILWVRTGARTDTGIYKAYAFWGLTQETPPLEVPLGRGVVGRLNERCRRISVPLIGDEGVRPYSPQLVAQEQWTHCLGHALDFHGSVVGALTMYAKLPSDNVQSHSLDDTSLFLASGIAQHRINEMTTSRQVEVFENRIERLQSGVVVLGLAHDLAHQAGSAASLVEAVAHIAMSTPHLPPEFIATANDLRQRARYVKGVTQALNKLAEKGRSEGRITKFDLGQAVNELEPVLKSMRRKVVLDTPAGITIHGEELAAQRIVLNLVSNAVAWTPQKGAKIVVRVLVRDGRAVLLVSDNGVGMDDATRREAMSLFFSKRKNGLGLGLYMVDRLTQRLGGEVSIDSQPLRGTVVSVSFPLRT